jgi:hypothetical protein
MGLSADRTTGQGKVDGADLSFVVNNGSQVFGGGICMINPGNGLQAASCSNSGMEWAGVCIRPPYVAGANVAGDGTLTATVRRRGTWSFKKTSAATSDLGKTAYVLDDQTVQTTLTGAATASTNTSAYIVGQIVKIIDSGTVEVDLGMRIPTATATGS